MSQWLTSEEAARRLGVKLSTLYAYVSRGRLVPQGTDDARRSLFAVEDVEALAGRSRSDRPSAGRLATITTSVTELRSREGPLYRGQAATELAEGWAFEETADLLWGAQPGSWAPAPVGAPPVTGVDDRLRWAVVMAGSRDPLRSDLRPEAIIAGGRAIVATMVAALEGRSTGDRQAPIATRLASRFVSERHPAIDDAVRAALVLLADHELASSTVAVRIAASTRADVYDAVLAGLGTINGPLHGGASGQAHRLLAEAARLGPAAALDASLRWQRAAPGFGHVVYRDGDPRFGALMRFVRQLQPEAQEVVDRLTGLARQRGLPEPNVDLALGALTFFSDVSPEAGGVVFKVARVAGWVAHYLEELEAPPLRYRARAIHVTRRSVPGPQ